MFDGIDERRLVSTQSVLLEYHTSSDLRPPPHIFFGKSDCPNKLPKSVLCVASWPSTTNLMKRKEIWLKVLSIFSLYIETNLYLLPYFIQFNMHKFIFINPNAIRRVRLNIQRSILESFKSAKIYLKHRTLSLFLLGAALHVVDNACSV